MRITVLIEVNEIKYSLKTGGFSLSEKIQLIFEIIKDKPLYVKNITANDYGGLYYERMKFAYHINTTDTNGTPKKL